MSGFRVSARHLAREHAGLLVLLAAGAALRVLAMVAVYPGMWFPDSGGFVKTAATGILNPLRVSGYSLFVAPFEAVGSAGALIGVQHLIGLGTVAGLYAVLRHRGVSWPLALAAVVPAALDGFVLVVEHTIMSDTLYHALLVGAIALLLWNDRPGTLAVGAAGLVVGLAGITRSVGAPFAAVFVLYLLARRVGWRPILAFVVGWAIVTGGYMTVFNAQHGRFALNAWGGHFLYARVAPYADCAWFDRLPPGQRQLCPDPASDLTTNGYLWNPRSPIKGLGAPHDPRLRDFAVRVIKDRPVTYAKVVLGDFLHYFEPGQRIRPNDHTLVSWRFPVKPGQPGNGYYGPIRPPEPPIKPRQPGLSMERIAEEPRTNTALSQFLRKYQRYAYTSGQVLAISALLVLIALLARRGPARLRLDAALMVAVPLAGLLLAAALSQFTYRYGLIGPMLLPAAAALALTALRSPRPAH